MKFATMALAMAATISSNAIASEPREITAPGPEGDLAGTLIPPANGKPTILIVPGSGPTDRDGNNPMGVTSASYRLLAQALAERGIGTARIDKRGMFGSAAAAADPNNVTFADYGDDVHAWVKSIQSESGAECVWVLGHSEGGLVALEAGLREGDICGLILVASVGRPIGTILREQLQANPANAPLLEDAFAAIDSLEAGERVDVEGKHPALMQLFSPAIQGYWIDFMARDPGEMAGRVDKPILIVAGGKDLQTPVSDGEALATGQPDATLVVFDDMNHVLKAVEGEGRGENLATYANPDLPIYGPLVEVIAEFVEAESDSE